ncbi:MAG: Hsp20/alpha crystallin family protein [Nitrososphaerota archaeon]|nr:Hsp20/alpha crystallin family protein [Nitrososphaerota archaeon]
MPESRKQKKLAKPGPIVPWTPEDYAREIDRAFADFERRFDRSWFAPLVGSWRFPHWRAAELPDTRRVSTDLIDTGTDYRVCAEVPGIPKEKLNVVVTPKDISIEGVAQTSIDESKEGFVHRERAYSKIKSHLFFPEEVIADKAEATVKEGILEVRIPKKTPTESKTHKVEIK